MPQGADPGSEDESLLDQLKAEVQVGGGWWVARPVLGCVVPSPVLCMRGRQGCSPLLPQADRVGINTTPAATGELA